MRSADGRRKNLLLQHTGTGSYWKIGPPRVTAAGKPVHCCCYTRPPRHRSICIPLHRTQPIESVQTRPSRRALCLASTPQSVRLSHEPRPFHTHDTCASFSVRQHRVSGASGFHPPRVHFRMIPSVALPFRNPLRQCILLPLGFESVGPSPGSTSPSFSQSVSSSSRGEADGGGEGSGERAVTTRATLPDCSRILPRMSRTSAGNSSSCGRHTGGGQQLKRGQGGGHDRVRTRRARAIIGASAGEASVLARSGRPAARQLLRVSCCAPTCILASLEPSWREIRSWSETLVIPSRLRARRSSGPSRAPEASVSICLKVKVTSS